MMKKFMIGLILGATLMLGVSAHAEVVSLVGKAIEGQFPVMVQGETITSPGIVVNGTSYLPTRTIAELAGYDVAFDADLGIKLAKKSIVMQNANGSQEVVIDVNERLKSIENELHTQKRTLEILKNDMSKSNINKEGTQKSIDDISVTISALEAEKAALEAQLAAQ